MFDINNSVDFYAKLLAEFDDFAADNSSSRHAMNFCITAHHLYDWVWGDFLKKDDALRQKLGVGKRKEDFAKWIEEHSVWFTLCQEISNGSKHFIRECYENVNLAPHKSAPKIN
jgi:hypothetical protein